MSEKSGRKDYYTYVDDDDPGRCGGGHGDVARCILPAYHMGDCQMNQPRFITVEALGRFVRRHGSRANETPRADMVKVTGNNRYYAQGGALQAGRDGPYWTKPMGGSWMVRDGDIVNFRHGERVYCMQVVGGATRRKIEMMLVDYNHGFGVDLVDVVPPFDPDGDWYIDAFVEQRGWLRYWIKFEDGEPRFADEKEGGR